MAKNYARNRTLMWILFGLLVILHHDWWYWNDRTLLGGFLPIGLGWHILISIAAGLLWGWAALYAWPDNLEDVAGPGETH